MVGIQLSALTKNLSANNLEITLGRNRDELTANEEHRCGPYT